MVRGDWMGSIGRLQNVMDAGIETAVEIPVREKQMVFMWMRKVIKS